MDYLPPVEAVPTWPVAGGPADQTVQNADAGKAFQVAWSRPIGTGSKGKRRKSWPSRFPMASYDLRRRLTAKRAYRPSM